MTITGTFRALTLAAGLAVALPGLAMAEGWDEPVGNGANAVGNPLAQPMAVTQATPRDLTQPVGRSAAPSASPLAQPQPVTRSANLDQVPGPVGNSASDSYSG